MNFTRNSIWDGAGLKISIGEGFLCVEDLNPDKKIKYRVSRWELFRIGWWLLCRAAFIGRAG